MKVTVALLLVCAVAVNAQIQICDPNLKPGQVPSANIRQGGSTNSGAYSDLKIDWDRPKDAISGDINSCIESYDVKIIRRDGTVLQSATVSVSPPHVSASHTFKGLGAGDTYKFQIQPKGTKQAGPSNGPLGAFTTAKKPSAVPLRL